MSASKFAQANRSAHLEKMAATVRSLEGGSRGEDSMPSGLREGMLANNSADRFVPSPEAVMEALVTSTDLPRDAVHRHSERYGRGGADAGRRGQFPGAVDNGKRGELVRKMVLSLGLLCFMLAGGLLYYYYFSPYGPHSTNEVAQQFSDSVGHDAQTAAQQTEASLARGEGGADVGNLSGVPLGGAAALAPSIKVHVAGAVNKPGLVSLPFEARIDDAVKAAGGFSSEADRSSVNLAKYVSDGDQILVKSLRSSAPSGGLSVAVEDDTAPSAEKQAHHSKKSGKKRASSAHAVSGSAAVSNPGESGSDSEGQSEGDSEKDKAGVVFGKVNINMANAMELLQLRGVGPQTAEAIVQYREALPNRAFTSVEQLKDVPGIGEAKLAEMREQVEL